MVINKPDMEATAATRARYNRIAPLYDWIESIIELRYQRWRRRFWQEVTQAFPNGAQLLEVGVGTGKNMRFWPEGAKITAIDLAPGMLQRARKRAHRMGINAQLELADSQALKYPDNSFDSAAATFVFCSVPDPVQGLRELKRTVRPGGYVFLMEHVRAPKLILRRIMDFLNPLVVRIIGANINRDTVANILRAGLKLDHVEDLDKSEIFKFIVARVPETG